METVNLALLVATLGMVAALHLRVSGVAERLAKVEGLLDGLEHSVNAVRAELSGEISGLRGDMHAEFAKIRQEFSEGTSELRERIAMLEKA